MRPFQIAQASEPRGLANLERSLYFSRFAAFSAAIRSASALSDPIDMNKISKRIKRIYKHKIIVSTIVRAEDRRTN